MQESPFSPLPSPLFLLASCLLLLISCAVRPTVKIGLVAPFEGRYRYVGYDAIYAARLAVREINAAGGVNGYAVELVAYDDGADPSAAIEQAHKLVVDPEVLAAVGHFRAETTAAAAPVYSAAGLPLFSTAPPDNALAEALVGRLWELGYRRAALIGGDRPLGEALRRAALLHGIALRRAATPEDVSAADVDAVLCAADAVTAGEWIAALQANGWQGVFLGGPELAAADFAAVAGAAAIGAEFVTPWPVPPDGIPATFEQAYRDASGGLPPGPLAFPTYQAVWMLCEALEQDIAAHGTPTRQGVAAALADPIRTAGNVPLHWYSMTALKPVRSH